MVLPLELVNKIITYINIPILFKLLNLFFTNSLLDYNYVNSHRNRPCGYHVHAYELVNNLNNFMLSNKIKSRFIIDNYGPFIKIDLNINSNDNITPTLIQNLIIHLLTTINPNTYVTLFYPINTKLNKIEKINDLLLQTNFRSRIVLYSNKIVLVKIKLINFKLFFNLK